MIPLQNLQILHTSPLPNPIPASTGTMRQRERRDMPTGSGDRRAAAPFFGSSVCHRLAIVPHLHVRLSLTAHLPMQILWVGLPQWMFAMMRGMSQ